MFQIFNDFKSPKEFLQESYKNALQGDFSKSNLLIFDDNLNAMQFLLQEKAYKNALDLIYIDPPFATNNTFRMGSTISASLSANVAYDDKFSLEAYLEFLYYRFILMREMLSEKGSIYVHTDSKIGHYVKIVLDEIFGKEHFINDITRIKCNPKNFAKKGYGNVKDSILFYSKGADFIWNEVSQKVSQSDLAKRFNKRDEKGAYTTIPLHAPGETKNGESGQEWNGLKPPKGRHWRCALSELDSLQKEGLIEWSKNGNPRKKIYAKDYGYKKIQDIWEFKDSQKVLYPTQKNTALLRQILLMSSNENSLVMDCFCGGGGFLQEASCLKRKFIGIDESAQAIAINKEWIIQNACECFIVEKQKKYIRNVKALNQKVV
ncbi:MAG: type II restriction/modification system, DNA methyltransferase [Candidatus Campylobacter infans]|nr:MAG: type II restriction/modification system, DNA methyltransferase [Candidatus Campylobacter infans]